MLNMLNTPTHAQHAQHAQRGFFSNCSKRSATLAELWASHGQDCEVAHDICGK